MDRLHSFWASNYKVAKVIRLLLVIYKYYQPILFIFSTRPHFYQEKVRTYYIKISLKLTDIFDIKSDIETGADTFGIWGLENGPISTIFRWELHTLC